MSNQKHPGKSAPPGKRSPFADRRLLLPLGFVLLVVGFYVFQWWQENADRAAMRHNLLTQAQQELVRPKPDLDVLGDLMASITRLPDAATAPELLAVQAEIELLRGRPERADRMFGAIAASPSASPADQRLGARILLAKQTGFGGDAAEQRAMLQQVVAFSERAYADGGDVKDVFRAWQAAKRMWDHPRAEQFAQQLAQQHGDSMQHRLVALSASFDPARDAVALADLVIDFGDDAPAELAALQTAAVLQSGKVPEALAKAEKDLLRYAGVGGVRYVLAIVLHACVLGSAEGSLDRATFAKKRDLQLDWLAARAPADEPLRQRWQAMRAIR